MRVLSRMRLCTRMSVLLALLPVMATMAAAIAGEDVPDQVRRRYLREPEGRALAALAAAGENQSSGEDDPGSMLAAAREGFRSIVEASARSFSHIPVKDLARDAVRGLLIEPEEADGGRMLLYLHGGGFMVGDARTGAAIAAHLAEKGGFHAFSLEYPLAPEAPYPAQLDNAVAAYRMLLSEGVLPENIVIAGDSAGGNLCLALLQRLRALSLPMPAGAYLISPWSDLAHLSPTHEGKKGVDAILDRDFLEMCAASYVGDGDRLDPLVSPVHADLRGFPPLLIQVGSFEILLDDSLTVARNAALADVPVKLSVWPGYYHDFPLFSISLRAAERALDEAADFLRRAMDGTLVD